MSNEKQETIADIVREMRTIGRLDEKSTDKIPRTLQALGLRTYADRIEAAHKREVAELKRKMNDVVCENEALRDACGTCGAKRELEATCEKSSLVGNAAKMREALKETQSVIAKCMDILNMIPSGVPYDGLIDDVADELGDLRDSCVNPALAVPPRNCDVGTADEQTNSYLAFCDRHTCQSCPVGFKRKTDCGFIWAQMPYEEGGAK